MARESGDGDLAEPRVSDRLTNGEPISLAHNGWRLLQAGTDKSEVGSSTVRTGHLI